MVSVCLSVCNDACLFVCRAIAELEQMIGKVLQYVEDVLVSVCVWLGLGYQGLGLRLGLRLGSDCLAILLSQGAMADRICC